jgi:predicted nucleic acid-binding protein
VRYWDTSALAKLYVREPDSARFLALITESGEPLRSSVVAASEMLCVAWRKERTGGLKPGGARAVLRRFHADREAGRIVLVPYGGDVAAEADRIAGFAFGQPEPLVIRSLDLIHLASAAVIRANEVVATGARLRALASTLGAAVFPPR